MELIAGIDGGGTKTNVVCQTMEGKTLAQKTFGPFNLNGIGETQFLALLKQITDFLCSLGNCRALVIGAAGASNPILGKLTSQAITQAGISNWQVVGDHEIALCGALEGQPGCLLIAGTGTICFGQNEQGKRASAGGWGHLIGDEGSGYALGRDALHTLVHYKDGMGISTLLTQLLEVELGLATRDAIVTYVYGGDKGRIAAIAPLVERAATLGDTNANQILQNSAFKLAALVSAVSSSLGLNKAEVALCGGLLEHETLLRQMLLAVMKNQLPAMRCVVPKQSAVFGAVRMARELSIKN